MGKPASEVPDVLAACVYCGWVVLADYVADPKSFKEATDRARVFQEKHVMFRGTACRYCLYTRPKAEQSEYRVLKVRIAT